MSSSFDCLKCGASLPVPADLSVTVVRCRFCATDQLAPGLEARQRVLASPTSPVASPPHEVAPSGRARWIFLPGVLFVGVSFVFAFSSLFHAPSTPSVPTSARGAASSEWDGAHTLECTGKQVLNLYNVHAKVQGVAIRANGRCVVSIEGGTITADTAIVASGHAQVHLYHVVVDAPIATDASENAQIGLFGSRTNGRRMARDRASLTDIDM
jgi:ribosomal protein L40E